MQLRPSDIRYSQDSISNKWNPRYRPPSGRLYIGETLDDICEGRCTIKQFPMISAESINGRWVTADNRRLWVFKHLERLGKCQSIEIRITSVPAPKLTSHNGGISIRVRGGERGTWHSKPDAIRIAGTSESQNHCNTITSSTSSSALSMITKMMTTTHLNGQPIHTHERISRDSNVKNTGYERASQYSSDRPPVSEGFATASAESRSYAADYTPISTSKPIRARNPAERHIPDHQTPNSQPSPKQGTLGYTSYQLPIEYESFVIKSFRRIRRHASTYHDGNDSTLLVEVACQRLKQMKFIRNRYRNMIVVETPKAIVKETVRTSLKEGFKKYGIQYNLWYRIDVDLGKLWKCR